jgi:hypothetical protein
LALNRENFSVIIDAGYTSKAVVKFRKKSRLTLINITTIKTTIGPITFYIIEAPTLFLIYIQDIDKLEIYFYNTTNKLVLLQNSGPDITILVT